MPETHTSPAHDEGPEEPDSSPAPPLSPENGAVWIELSLNLDDDDPPLAGWLEPLAAEAARAAGVRQGQLSIAVVNDEQMAQFHQRYLDIAGTTDVLTFNLGDRLADDQIEGEVIVCLDEARRQSASRGHGVRHEVLLYVVYGILHLMGEDDQDPESFEHMHAREDQILSGLGMGAVFSRKEGTG
ncbi:MAG: rRNA maturation RNase YbeY [Planctomycetota bacterium]